VRGLATKSRGSKVRVWLPGYLFPGGVKLFAHAGKIVTNGNLGLWRSDGPNSPGKPLPAVIVAQRFALFYRFSTGRREVKQPEQPGLYKGREDRWVAYGENIWRSRAAVGAAR
jgi:hypothetical protein